MKKPTRGGQRKGSGAKQKYNERTVTIAVRCPESKAKILKSCIKELLKTWLITK